MTIVSIGYALILFNNYNQDIFIMITCEVYDLNIIKKNFSKTHHLNLWERIQKRTIVTNIWFPEL